MFAALHTKLKGYRTLIGAAALGGLGLANEFNGIDFTPLVQMFVRDQHVLAVAMIGIAVFFGVTRWATTGPVGDNGTHGDDSPKKNVDDGE